jgi:hypothetical protein
MVSPLYEDGNFDLITIPEHDDRLGRMCLKYSDLQWHDPVAIRAILGQRRWNTTTHNDPDLWNGVYGDLPYSSPRAAALRKATPGDGMLFFARLRPYDGRRFDGAAGFYFVSSWWIDKVIDVRENTRLRLDRGIADNPHIRKRAAGNRQRFSLYVASPPPNRLTPPVRIDRLFLARTLPESTGWTWNSGRSLLQTIGSYLRTVRAVNAADHQDLLELVRVGG